MIDTLPKPSRRALMDSLATPAARFPLLDRLRIGYRPLISPLHEVLARIPAGGRLFDIGCGSGTLLHLALKHRGCAAAHGYDVSAHAVGNANRRCPVINRRLNISRFFIPFSFSFHGSGEESSTVA